MVRDVLSRTHKIYSFKTRQDGNVCTRVGVTVRTWVNRDGVSDSKISVYGSVKRQTKTSIHYDLSSRNTKKPRTRKRILFVQTKGELFIVRLLKILIFCPLMVPNIK